MFFGKVHLYSVFHLIAEPIISVLLITKKNFGCWFIFSRKKVTLRMLITSGDKMCLNWEPFLLDTGTRFREKMVYNEFFHCSIFWVFYILFITIVNCISVNCQWEPFWYLWTPPPPPPPHHRPTFPPPVDMQWTTPWSNFLVHWKESFGFFLI